MKAAAVGCRRVGKISVAYGKAVELVWQRDVKGGLGWLRMRCDNFLDRWKSAR